MENVPLILISLLFYVIKHDKIVVLTYLKVPPVRHLQPKMSTHVKIRAFCFTIKVDDTEKKSLYYSNIIDLKYIKFIVKLIHSQLCSESKTWPFKFY